MKLFVAVPPFSCAAPGVACLRRSTGLNAWRPARRQRAVNQHLDGEKAAGPVVRILGTTCESEICSRSNLGPRQALWASSTPVRPFPSPWPRHFSAWSSLFSSRNVKPEREASAPVGQKSGEITSESKVPGAAASSGTSGHVATPQTATKDTEKEVTRGFFRSTKKPVSTPVPPSVQTLASSSQPVKARASFCQRMKSFVSGFLVASGIGFYVLFYQLDDSTLRLQVLAKDAAHQMATVEAKLHALERRVGLRPMDAMEQRKESGDD
ncbi:transmembrane protein [Cystoisospora suis]|uniref:Transmembrane protein n=1 Tax=Cystoisospora suis TaxID=483139 RepID=A0A2C6L9M7_9APIC|nr:transmembrane protein [Cystoisospora suis]